MKLDKKNRKIFTSAAVAVATAGMSSAAPLRSMAAAADRVSPQPVLSQRHKPILTVGTLRFRDLNGDGKLEPYEDWRLPPEDRADDLVGRMTIDEKIGLMVIGTQSMGAPPADSRGGCGAKGKRSANGLLCEEKVVTTTNNWAEPGSSTYNYLAPVVRTYPTTEGIQKYGIRRFIIRENPPPAALTTWTNSIQEVAEQSRLGIPVVMTSNPRNHASTELAFGFNEASGQFSTWPGTLGLAATGDVRLVNDFARIARSEWNATGIRGGYMYQADVGTDPRWFRIDGTFGDDPVVVSDMITAIVDGFQGNPLGTDGVLMTTKHFPGGGARDKGSDPHYGYGRVSPYPTAGSLFQYHLPPFTAAIAAGTAAIMPYYAMPANGPSSPQLAGGAKFEEIGFAFNRAIIQDLLRTQLGFKGYVNSDSGILFAMPWGARIEAMDYPQRAAYAINAGVDVISDMQDVGIIRTAYDRGLVSSARIDLSARRLLEPIFKLGLFENPYRDPKAAEQIVKDPAHWAKAYEAHQKSVVLMKNAGGLLPLTDAKASGAKIFIKYLGHQDRTDETIKTLQASDKSLTFTTDLAEAGLAIVFVVPEDKTDRKVESYFDLDVHTQTGVDVAQLAQIEAKVPTIVVMNLEMPWLLANVEPKSRALLAGFSTRPDAVLDVIRGRVKPSGKLPITVPRDIAVVVAAETNGPEKKNGVVSSDVPGFARAEKDNYVYRDTAGAAYKTGFGLTY